MPDMVVTPSGAWFRGRRLARTIGRAGITPHKREGDGATPAGRLRITAMLYRPDRIAPAGLPPWAGPIHPGDIWSDDPRDPHYNCRLRGPRPFSHEVLWRADRLYDLILVTDWNREPARPGAGSAIFLHAWRGPARPTEGCIAFAPADLLWIARRMRQGAGVVVKGHDRH